MRSAITTRKCPHCSKEIQEDVIICKYCNNSLSEPTNKKNINTIVKTLDYQQTLEEKKVSKNRNLAITLIAIILFLGIGLDIYFDSISDFSVPVLISIFLLALVGDIGFLNGSSINNFLGYFKIKNSN
jgi:hypothetical protein